MQVCFAYFNIIAEYLVKTYFERFDPGTGALFAFQIPDPNFSFVDHFTQPINLLMVSVPDDAPVFQVSRGVVRQGIKQQFP